MSVITLNLHYVNKCIPTQERGNEKYHEMQFTYSAIAAGFFPRSHIPTFPHSHVPSFPRSCVGMHIWGSKFEVIMLNKPHALFVR